MRFAWIVEPPFNFRRGDTLTGCDVELAREVFSRLGEAFEPVEAEFGDLLDGLAGGRWDVTTGMFVTSERARRASFTRPIWSLRDGLLVKGHDAGVIRGYRDLALSGERLAVLEGQIQHRTALDLGVSESNIIVLRNYDEAAEAVTAGRVRAYASVELAHRDYIRRHDGLSCVPVPDAEKTPETGGFACRNDEIRQRLDSILMDVIGSDDHRALLRSFDLDPDSIQPVVPERRDV